jgi:hypothetical protein
MLIPVFQQLTGINAIMFYGALARLCTALCTRGSTGVQACTLAGCTAGAARTCRRPRSMCRWLLPLTLPLLLAALPLPLPPRAHTALAAPQLFQAAGQAADAALLSTLITGAVNVGSTVVAIIVVDRLGRRFLFLEGGIQMIICEVRAPAAAPGCWRTQPCRAALTLLPPLRPCRSCCAVLCCAVLCCAVLCCAVLCCAVLCCAVLCCAHTGGGWSAAQDRF